MAGERFRFRSLLRFRRCGAAFASVSDEFRWRVVFWTERPICQGESPIQYMAWGL